MYKKLVLLKEEGNGCFPVHRTGKISFTHLSQSMDMDNNRLSLELQFGTYGPQLNALHAVGPVPELLSSRERTVILWTVDP